MNKKSYLAGLLILPLGAAEVIESEHPLLAALRQPSLESGTSYTLAGNPHTHCDVETGVCATTAAPFSASGARRAEEIFRLHVIPQQTGGIRLVAFPALNLWVTAPSETQNMYGFCETVDALCELLASRLGLPQSQLEALRKTAVAGGREEIGGYTAMRIFRRSALERLGMSFRPPEA
jgi:hypothetical protein